MSETTPQGEALVQEDSGHRFVHEMFYPPESFTRPRPGILLAPNFFGPAPSGRRQARSIADQGYVVMLMDYYGESIRPADADEAVAAMKHVAADLPELRRRTNTALSLLREHGENIVDAGKLAAIGFCFGGKVALELARSGADILAAVTLHGALSTDLPAAPGDVKASVLVLHGADDPAVPQSQVEGFVREMHEADVEDWQLVQYGQTVHSFTEPSANVPGRSQYQPRSTRRAFAQMYRLFDEVFAERDV